MRVNIVMSKESHILEDYQNISDRFIDDKVIKVESLINLDGICCDGELEELRAYEVVEYLPDDVLEASIKCWMKKVSIGGYLTISALDMYELAYLITNGQMEIHQASSLIYGGKNNCFSCGQMIRYFKENNFSIDRVMKENIKFSIRGKRNG